MKHFYKPKLHITNTHTLKATQSVILSAAFNNTTNIITSCTQDGRIFLGNISMLQNNTASFSTIQVTEQPITKFIWINNHEFAISGGDNGIITFDIIDLSSEVYHPHNSGISCMECRDTQIYSGSTDGTVAIMDMLSRRKVNSIGHLVRKNPQPIKDIDIDGNYLYTTTVPKGRVWVWDLRNTKSKLGMCETNRYESSIKSANVCLFGLGNNHITKFSQDLSVSEIEFHGDSYELFPQGKIDYLHRFNALIWNYKDSLFIKTPGIKDSFTKIYNGLNGFEVISNNRILLYTKEGELFIEKLKLGVCEESL